MGARWNPLGFRLLSLLVLIQGCWSVSDEGLALLAFKENVKSDPFGALENWSPEDGDPCLWTGVRCVDNRVQMLNLTDLSLEGTLAPSLGKLTHLKSLMLCKNHLTGEIPKEIGGLERLEVLDLRDNGLSGTIPVEIGRMCSLKRLWLDDNRFESGIPLPLKSLHLLTDSATVTGFGSVNRKFGHCIWQSNFNHWIYENSLALMVKGSLTYYLSYLTMPSTKQDSLHVHGDACCENLSNSLESDMIFARRSLKEQAYSVNLQAMPYSGPKPSIQIITLPTGQSSGAFPAAPDAKEKNSLPPAPAPAPAPLAPPTSSSQDIQKQDSQNSSSYMWKYIVIGISVAVLLVVLALIICMCRCKAVKTITPWKTGISGQLQKAFITGVPKLNRSELETACEDFSNIISTVDGCIVYKGTLSSGVEIAVASTTLASLKDWSKNAEKAYRKKIDQLSRVNHKNFVNLIGYCEENQPFTRMMVFEYAPNGNLYEHLHVEEMEHLDWSARVRIIMGTAYCLQYMHHDLNPPVSHPNLVSSSIYLTDDYAAKIAELCFWATLPKSKKDSDDDEKENSELPPLADPETNVYSFGLLIIETISGKRQNSEVGCLVEWASAYLNEQRGRLVDPSLKSFKKDELDVMCEVIKECTKKDPRKRPSMIDVNEKLRQVIHITPNQAVPSLSPLWWAELEILSMEAT